MTRAVILDTHVILSGLRSNRGCSYQLLESVNQNRLVFYISVPLVLEYESVLKHQKAELGLTNQDIDSFLDYLSLMGRRVKIHYLWRPFLKDPYDDHILELAFNAGRATILSFNKKDFKGSDELGIPVFTPREWILKGGLS